MYMWHRQRTNTALLHITRFSVFKIFLLTQKGQLKKGNTTEQLDQGHTRSL